MYSTEQVEQLVLYPDEACRDTGLAQAIVNVTFLPCPDGFVQSGDQCVCEKRLQTYTDQCIVGDEKTTSQKSLTQDFGSVTPTIVNLRQA